MLFRLFITLALSLFITIAQAENNVVYKLRSGIEAVARYTPGDKQKPVIFILHGFLTTNNFNTLLSLGQILHENGFSVLAPNLTLGINRRDSGLPCKAIHTNTMEDDIDEVSDWVSWLVKKGHRKIMLLGHSQGSIKLLAYVTNREIPEEVKLVIATSLSYIDAFIDAEEKQGYVTQAENAMRHNITQPGTYSLSYCKSNFTAPANVFLSWVQWNQKQIIISINKAPVPVYIIMGGRDRHYTASWVRLLKETRASVTSIKQASHFFDGSEEFDFHDTILDIIAKNDF